MKLFLATGALLVLGISGVRADPFSIVPGQSLGQTHLGAYDLNKLPPPDGADAAMGGKRWLAWKAKTSLNTLAIYAVSQEYEDPPLPGVTILEIRATSPHFHTQSGVSPGASLAQVKRHFPQGRMKLADDETCWFYTLKQGIAFEFSSHPRAAAHCRAVTVFAPGGSADLNLQDALDVRDLLAAGAH